MYFFLDCPMNCSSCDSQNCLSCNEDYTLFHSRAGDISCKFCNESGDYFLKNSSTCVRCVENCDICSSSNECKKCSKDFFPLNENKCIKCKEKNQIIFNDQCYICDPHCDECLTNEKCLKCSAGFTKNMKTFKCEPNCSPNQFYSEISNSCEKCNYNCKKCFNGSNNGCISCIDNLFLYSNQCFQTCPLGTFEDKKNSICSGIIFLYKF